MLSVDADQVLAFRLGSHHLDARLPTDRLSEAAGACGVQDTPAGSARTALHARVALVPGDLDQAFEQRTLVQLWSIRGAPFTVPATDVGIFTIGALPEDEESWRVYMQGAAGQVDTWAGGPDAALARVAAAMAKALEDARLSKAELSGTVTDGVPDLAAWCARCAVRHVPESLFRAAGISAGLVIAIGEDDAQFTLLDHWMGPRPAVDPDLARAELVRRYLHCYGPATPALFAEWTQRSRADAQNAFDLVADELVEVHVSGKPAVLLDADEPGLAAPAQARGVRLLPPLDPYLQQRDRATLLPDKTQRAAVWKPVGAPGAVLVDGLLAGTWRAQKRATKLVLTAKPFAAFADSVLAALEAEASALARLRGAASVEVTVQS